MSITFARVTLGNRDLLMVSEEAYAVNDGVIPEGVTGAICTEEEYTSRSAAYAFLYEFGAIMSRGKFVGTRQDLKFVEFVPDPLGKITE